MDKITIIGHLGRDPEMRYTPDGQAVTSFSAASSRKYKTAAGEQREETEWFNVSAWVKLSEVCNEYLTKGKQVYVEGRLKTRAYQTQAGERRFSINVTCQEIRFLGGGQGQGQEPESVGFGLLMCYRQPWNWAFKNRWYWPEHPMFSVTPRWRPTNGYRKNHGAEYDRP